MVELVPINNCVNIQLKTLVANFLSEFLNQHIVINISKTNALNGFLKAVFLKTVMIFIIK